MLTLAIALICLALGVAIVVALSYWQGILRGRELAALDRLVEEAREETRLEEAQMRWRCDGEVRRWAMAQRRGPYSKEAG